MPGAVEDTQMSRLKEKYVKEVAPALAKAGGYTNPMRVPRMVKIVLNMGINSSVDKDVFKSLLSDLGRISGQAPLVRRAKKSISNFKLRQGMPVGAKVTLRGARMFEFFDRLVNIVLPRLRDFRGVPPDSFDGRGNYSMGLAEQAIFPEINPDEVKKAQGMDITIVTTARTDDEARELLRMLGMPFAAPGSAK